MSANVWPKAVPLLILAVLLAYANCINKTLVFDDDAWIVDMPALDDPPKYFKEMDGRPLLAVTNLVLHRCGRGNPVGHHVLNVLIHIAATLTLYGIIRRSLLRPHFLSRFEGRAPYLAFAATLLWALHPLQVQSVTYIIQRGESMAGLFYMFILYAMLCGDEDEPDERYTIRRFAWYALAVGSLVLGWASKETMASVPGAVILFDRIFIARSWRELLRRRWIFYLIFLLVWGAFTYWHLKRAGEGAGNIGFHMETVTPKTYALTQAGVLLYYLQLCIWPRGMAIDYQGWPWWKTFDEAMPEVAIVVGLLLVSSILLFWRPAVGFVCIWFFIVLSPTSSILPIVDPVFEHRMYLALATVTVLAVFLGDWLLRFIRLRMLRPIVLSAAATALGVLTHLRNEDYRTREAVWELAVERMPDSVRARSNYAQGLIIANRNEEAVPVLERALEITPHDITSLINLASAYEQLGNFAAAEDKYRKLRDFYGSDWKNWRMHAAALLVLGRWDEAEADYRKAGELQQKAVDEGKEAPALEPHYGRAAALREIGRFDLAEDEAAAASKIDPDWPAYVLANARNTILEERLRKSPDAMRSALTWAKLGIRYLDSPTATHRDTLGLCYAALGDFERAVEQSRLALKEKPPPHWEEVHRDRIKHYERKRVPWPE